VAGPPSLGGMPARWVSCEEGMAATDSGHLVLRELNVGVGTTSACTVTRGSNGIALAIARSVRLIG
jgi:hypothetical protein